MLITDSSHLWSIGISAFKACSFLGKVPPPTNIESLVMDGCEECEALTDFSVQADSQT
jgi:hypothetical protein